MSTKQIVKNNTLVSLLSKSKVKEFLWVAAFAFLTFLAAQVTVPTQPVPFTLQTMLVLLSGAFLGSRNGAISQILYLAIGVAGLPVFSGFGFGLVKLFGPTGGYLLAFPFAAFLVGYIIEKKQTSFRILFSLIIGQLFILLSGATYLSLFMNGDFLNSLFSGAVIFSIWDVIKIAAAFSIYKAISKKYPKLPA